MITNQSQKTKPDRVKSDIDEPSSAQIYGNSLWRDKTSDFNNHPTKVNQTGVVSFENV